MTGKIMKGIGGFYYVYVEGAGLYECRAKGIFRNKKVKPNVGDIVDIDVISEEEKTGNLTVIHKRKNQLIRPRWPMWIRRLSYLPSMNRNRTFSF